MARRVWSRKLWKKKILEVIINLLETILIEIILVLIEGNFKIVVGRLKIMQDAIESDNQEMKLKVQEEINIYRDII